MRILSDLWHNRWFRAGLITLGLVVLPKLALKLAAIQDNIWAETGADTLTTLVAILRMSPLASEALTSVVDGGEDAVNKKGF